MKSFFSLVNSVVGGESKEPEKKIVMPWEDYKDQAKELNIKGSLTDVIRDKIMEIPHTPQVLLDNSNPLDNFVLDEHLEVIMKLLEIDANLREVFRREVPKRISEENFWKNYFDKVDSIKLSVFQAYSKNPKTENLNNLFDELDRELEAEFIKVYESNSASKKPKKPVESAPPPKPPTSEVDELKKQLEIAMKKIQDLESRVEALESAKKLSENPT